MSSCFVTVLSLLSQYTYSLWNFIDICKYLKLIVINKDEEQEGKTLKEPFSFS